MRRFVSWNVNGVRACLKNGFAAHFAALEADVICLQETKAQEEQVDFAPEGYCAYWHSAEKKGYSGTAVFSRFAPVQVSFGIDMPEHDHEGRVITLEFPEYFLVNTYTPNSRDGLVRLEYRMAWEDAFRGYLLALDQKKPVIVCGDMNVAHKEIDLAHPAANRRNPGFTEEERGKFSALLEAGFADSFRHFYPEKTQAYSWWSYRARARERNVGWRIDYFLTSRRLLPQLTQAGILAQVRGSDHCPVWLEMEGAPHA
ncbi:MAG: exodeoxyribonuclease III [Oscillospiraceae bacterium]|nr:exodeoxyribonuclease III [Oscillospiraceae bacterium]